MENISAPRGVNLQVYLLGLYEAQTRKRDGMAGPCPLPILGTRGEISWSTIVVSAAKQNMQAKAPVTAAQNRSRQIKSAFKRLADENLAVRNIGDPANPYPVMFLHESGSPQFEKYGYTVPEWYENSPSTVPLPVDFFREGWVYLLTPAEIRMYLVLKHLASRFPDTHGERGIFIAERERQWIYGLSRDVYEAHLTLSRFGLIERMEDGSRHSDGKAVNYSEKTAQGEITSPHRFKVEPDSALRRPAWEKIEKSLMNYPPTFEQMKRKRG
ncbi:hypothetical protein [Streptomyces lavendulocolor]|uniref:hypothetical protein n=1 Tax=Streptomyces lavendulocolor TaxID=67316 RepID=UPI003C2CBDED